MQMLQRTTSKPETLRKSAGFMDCDFFIVTLIEKA